MNFRKWLEQTEELQQLVDQLLKEYPQLKKLSAWENEFKIELAMIEVEKDARSSGIGTAVMQKLNQYADMVGKPIVLSPEPQPRKKKALDNFYRRNGYVNNKGRNRDDLLSAAFHSTMYRRPNS